MRLPVLVALALALTACGADRAATTAPRRATPTFAPAVVSSNWSGYVARRVPGGAFDGVSAQWRMPRIACAPGAGSSAAFWVGLGGWQPRSPSLQQLGASADCSPTGAPVYRMWTEVVPAPPTFNAQRVAPGDVVAASLSVAHGTLRFELRNVTRGTRYTTHVTPRQNLDLSTAEWVAEAPALCRTISVCQVVPLSDFGTVAFTRVTATSGSVTGALAARAWRVTPVVLVTSGGSTRYVAASNPYGAVPGRPAAGGRGFRIAFRSSFAAATTPSHPLPGAPLPAWVR